jgi:hypothetical protein
MATVAKNAFGAGAGAGADGSGSTGGGGGGGSSNGASASASAGAGSNGNVAHVEGPAARKVILRRAKFNWKYKKRKKAKPRLNSDDLTVVAHMLKGTNVTFTYDPATNDLIFDTHTVATPATSSSSTVAGSGDLEIDGLDTGGQVVRSALQLAVLMAGGRSVDQPLGDLHVRSAGKACLLYVQGSMYTLKVGESFSIHGGTPTNADAPSFAEYCTLFDMLRDFIGRSFTLADMTPAGGEAHFVLTREADVAPVPDPSAWHVAAAAADAAGRSSETLSFYVMDQLLMALLFIKPALPCTIRLVADWDRDYHIAAMVKMLRLVGYSVEDVRDGARRIITVDSSA